MVIAYFSATGTTAQVARRLAALTGGELYEIQPENPYTSADLDWTDPASRSTREMKNPASRPEIAGPLPDLSDQDTVVIGFPNWWSTAPRIVQSFVEQAGLKGKRIWLFETSGGTGIEQALRDFSAAYPDLDIEGGVRLNAYEEAGIRKFAGQIS